jgi:hypothetical protein
MLYKAINQLKIYLLELVRLSVEILVLPNLIAEKQLVVLQLAEVAVASNQPNFYFLFF